MEKELKEKIIEILKDFDNCYFCEDEGGWDRKIELYLPKILELFTQEKQEWKREIALKELNQINKKIKEFDKNK